MSKKRKSTIYEFYWKKLFFMYSIFTFLYYALLRLYEDAGNDFNNIGIFCFIITIIFLVLSILVLYKLAKMDLIKKNRQLKEYEIVELEMEKCNELKKISFIMMLLLVIVLCNTGDILYKFRDDDIKNNVLAELIDVNCNDYDKCTAIYEYKYEENTHRYLLKDYNKYLLRKKLYLNIKKYYSNGEDILIIKKANPESLNILLLGLMIVSLVSLSIFNIKYFNLYKGVI